MNFRVCAFGTGVFAVGSLLCIRTVPPNNVAYTNLFGNVNTTKRMPGINFVNPFASMVNIPLLVNNFSSEISVATNEGLTLCVEINTIYKINENQARNVYLEFRYGYEKILIKPLIESILRNIMASYEAKSLYSDKTREEIQNRMETEVTCALKKNGINVSNVLINKITLPHQLQQSIETKLRIEQENEQMAFTIEKQRKEISFKLECEKMEAQRKIIEADGIQQFQQIVSKGISPELIKWKSIEATSDLAKSANAKVVIFGDSKNGGMPIIMSS
jgi:prohibitin 1